MNCSQIRSEMVRLQKTAADLEKQRGQHLERANKAAKSAADASLKASKTSSDASRKTYLRQVETEGSKQVAETKKAAEIAGKVADTAKRLSEKAAALQKAEQAERTTTERSADTRLRKEKQEIEKRHRLERDHAREVGRLSRTEIRHVIIEPPRPEKLRVLYLTADADPDRPLRVDAEVNNVLKAIRSARYADRMDVQVRPAATPEDLVNGINDLRPHVVHFSGHGDTGLLSFDTASYEMPETDTMTFEVLAQLLSATDQPPRLLVMNACRTLDRSEILLEAVPVLIAMSDEVNDASAGVFATHFYGAIASAQSIGHAVRQARAMLRQALLTNDAELPQIASRADIDVDTLTLIQGYD